MVPPADCDPAFHWRINADDVVRVDADFDQIRASGGNALQFPFDDLLGSVDQFLHLVGLHQIEKSRFPELSNSLSSFY
jgi:hypothetical protein